MLPPTLLLTTGLLAVLAPLAPGQTDRLDAPARQAVIESISEVLNARYVFPDVAEKCAEHLRERVAAGAFDDQVDAEAFAACLTRELQSISKDKHIVVHSRSPTAVEAVPEDLETVYMRRNDELRRQNYGFERVERLEGNIGYIDIRSFAPPNLAIDTATAAMAFVENCDALIFDLRQNGGGSPGMVQFLCSYLFDERVHLNSLYFREGDRTQEFWTLEGVPGEVLADVPVFVLTSSFTFSGAEEFTYNLRTRGRATVIGETTRGGANPGMYVDFDDRFGMFVPTGRAINPVTQTNWEGVGVEPHIAVDAEGALERALAEARPAALAHGDEALRRRIDLTLDVKQQILGARRTLEADTSNEAARSEATRQLESALREGLTAGVLDEAKIHRLGQDCLLSGSTQAALVILRFNTDQFPHSFRTWNSLAEAHAQAGATEQAIETFRKAIEVYPGNEHARLRLEELGKE